MYYSFSTPFLIYLTSFLFGANFECFQTAIRMKTGKRAGYYYGEVHKKELNIWMHIVGMPFTVYGILLWLPAIFQLSYASAHILQNMIYIMYIGHYMTFDVPVALFTSVMYAPSLYFAHDSYFLWQSALWEGLGVSTTALIFQEALGHYLSGDPQSRIEAVPNAIVYAVYFSAKSLRRRAQKALRICWC